MRGQLGIAAAAVAIAIASALPSCASMNRELRAETLEEALVLCETLATPADVLDCKDAALNTEWR